MLGLTWGVLVVLVEGGGLCEVMQCVAVALRHEVEQAKVVVYLLTRVSDVTSVVTSVLTRVSDVTWVEIVKKNNGQTVDEIIYRKYRCTSSIYKPIMQTRFIKFKIYLNM